MLLQRISIYFIVIALMACNSAYSKTPIHTETADTRSALQHESSMDSLVTVEWLHEHLDDPDLVVLDATVQIEFSENGEIVINSGRNSYEQGHIPMAGFADLTNDLVDTSSNYPYAIPTPEKFANAMGALGVGNNSRVVLYSSNYSAWAARVWWMLRWVGFDNAAVLDGGLNAWTAAGYPLSTEAVSKELETLSIGLRSDVIAERDEVFTAIGDAKVTLIDAMPAEHYRGEMVMYGRAGHIPTAINIPSVFAEDGHFLTDTVLENMHPFDRDARVITYCGGGISASANAFAMHRLGFTDVAVYMNSLDEWAADPANPLNVSSK